MEKNIEDSSNNPFIALRHKNFAFYLTGMCFSLIGTWMQNVAQPWLAYSLTQSPFLLSLVGILQFLPMLFFSLFAGVIIDRFPKKKILIFTQSASLLITFVLAILVWSGRVQYWHILIAATCLGFVNTLDMPTRQSFVIEMVGKEDLLNAIALNSSIFNAARILGPALAGMVMGYVGVSACFFINSISFAAVIISLFFIKPVNEALPQKKDINALHSIIEGLKYIKQSDVLIKTLLTTLIVGAFGMNINVILPVFTKLVLHQGEAGFGFLMSFMGAGSFIGSMFMAVMSRRGPQSFIIRFFPFLISALLIYNSFTRLYFLLAIGLAATGFCFVSFSATANSTIQFNTEDKYRGRVMSVYTLVFGGSTPIGNFYAGLITENFGPSAGFFSCGMMIILLMLLVLILRKKHEGSLKQDL